MKRTREGGTVQPHVSPGLSGRNSTTSPTLRTGRSPIISTVSSIGAIEDAALAERCALWAAHLSRCSLTRLKDRELAALLSCIGDIVRELPTPLHRSAGNFCLTSTSVLYSMPWDREQTKHTPSVVEAFKSLTQALIHTSPILTKPVIEAVLKPFVVDAAVRVWPQTICEILKDALTVHPEHAEAVLSTVSEHYPKNRCRVAAHHVRYVEILLDLIFAPATEVPITVPLASSPTRHTVGGTPLRLSGPGISKCTMNIRQCLFELILERMGELEMATDRDTANSPAATLDLSSAAAGGSTDPADESLRCTAACLVKRLCSEIAAQQEQQEQGEQQQAASSTTALTATTDCRGELTSWWPRALQTHHLNMIQRGMTFRVVTRLAPVMFLKLGDANPEYRVDLVHKVISIVCKPPAAIGPHQQQLPPVEASDARISAAQHLTSLSTLFHGSLPPRALEGAMRRLGKWIAALAPEQLLPTSTAAPLVQLVFHSFLAFESELCAVMIKDDENDNSSSSWAAKASQNLPDHLRELLQSRHAQTIAKLLPDADARDNIDAIFS